MILLLNYQNSYIGMNGGLRLHGFNFARLMGADPTTSHVTGERSTVELQPQITLGAF